MSDDKQSAEIETVHAHIERTVHALLDEIERRLPERQVVKELAEAVQALSVWPLYQQAKGV